jgi:gas vesicle protein
MGQSTDELRRDIELTREDMGVKVDAIEDRLSPSRVVQRQKNKVSMSMQSVRDRVMGTASSVEHEAADAVKRVPEGVVTKTQGAPLAAGAVAFGIGFIAAAVFPATEREKQAASKVMDSLEPAKQQLMDSAKETAEHLKEPATQAAQEIKQAASESAAEVKSTAREAAGEAKQQTTETMQGSPGNPGQF